MVPAPANIPALLPVTEGKLHDALEACLLRDDLEENLLAVGRLLPVRVWFTEPVDIQTAGRGWGPWETDADGRRSRTYRSGIKTVTEYVFPRLFRNEGTFLCYLPSRGYRHGYPFPLSKVARWEPLVRQRKDEFKTYEQFKARFDPHWVAEEAVQAFWAETSPQHGHKYRPSDFRQLGPQGCSLVERFKRGFLGLENFPRVLSSTGCYTGNGGGEQYYTERYASMSQNQHFGRDIKISHMLGKGFVWYSSEYPGCGNGFYGIIATDKTWLFMEKD